MGPVWQNPIQRAVRTTRVSVLMTAQSFNKRYNTEQLMTISHLTSRQLFDSGETDAYLAEPWSRSLYNVHLAMWHYSNFDGHSF